MACQGITPSLCKQQPVNHISSRLLHIFVGLAPLFDAPHPPYAGYTKRCWEWELF